MDGLRVIGQRLGAANLIEGSVRKAGPRVRITAQLIEPSSGFHLWSQEFDRDPIDVFAVQEEIARAVVTALRLELLPGQAEARPTVDPKAQTSTCSASPTWRAAHPDAAPAGLTAPGWRRPQGGESLRWAARRCLRYSGRSGERAASPSSTARSYARAASTIRPRASSASPRLSWAFAEPG